MNEILLRCIHSFSNSILHALNIGKLQQPLAVRSRQNVSFKFQYGYLYTWPKIQLPKENDYQIQTMSTSIRHNLCNVLLVRMPCRGENDVYRKCLSPHLRQKLSNYVRSSHFASYTYLIFRYRCNQWQIFGIGKKKIIQYIGKFVCRH